MQRSFDDLGTPLSQVTFVVLDLETTGASPKDCAITEVGAIKFKGGECLGTFQTLVNPGQAIPPEIVYLTGITQAMVVPAPRIESVLPAFIEFIGDAVIVGHNVRFDMGFLQTNLERLGYQRLRNRVVDTCGVARRLVREEVPNLRLQTLARHFRTAADPCHRALDDAKATAEVLHCLLERAGTLGILGLDDLLALPTTAAHPQAHKLKLVARLPRKPGVYLFKDRGGRVLYVGKAVELRRRVRSYFAGDDRRKIGSLLRETESIDWIVTAHELEAAVLEVRLIHQHVPRFNRTAKRWRQYAYVKLTLDERFPRLSVVRSPKPRDGCVYLGPLASTTIARAVQEAIESAVPIRRCTKRIGIRTALPVRPAACVPAQLGVAMCPCADACDPGEYSAVIASVVDGLLGEPSRLLAPLAARMRAMAEAQRFEEAAMARARAAALTRALARQRRLDALRSSGRMVVEVAGEGGAVLDAGRLVVAWSHDTGRGPEPMPLAPLPDGPVDRELADELSVVAAWLEARAAAGRLHVVSCEGQLAWPSARLPSFEPRERRTTATAA